MTISRARFCMVACAALALIAGRASGTLDTTNTGGPDGASEGLSQDPYANLPSVAKMLGVVRDFKPTGTQGGHPDFEFNAPAGGGNYRGVVQDQLGGDAKPIFASTGTKMKLPAVNDAGQAIIGEKAYLASKAGDMPGLVDAAAAGQPCMNGESGFTSWYRDVPGVNASTPLAITLVRQPNTNKYVFDDKSDPMFKDLGGFFPINGQLFGNSPMTPEKNFHFTYEMHATFVHNANTKDVFKFTGDDDVWVFIDGKLVIDLGGMHSAQEQVIELDRLGWLEHGQAYNLDFFFAERHTNQSNFRLETTLALQPVELPTTAGLAD